MIEIIIEEMILAYAFLEKKGVQITELSLKLPNGDKIMIK